MDGGVAEVSSTVDGPAIGRRFDIRAAGRHSTQVRLVRRAIIVGVPLFLVGLALVVVFQPFHLPHAFSLGNVHIQGTRIAVAQPHLSGYRADGTPYRVKASLGTQDLTTPNIIEMQDVDADVGMADRTTSHVTASAGRYDGGNDGLLLTGAVHMRNSSGYDVRTSSALVELKTGNLTAENGVQVALTAADINSDGMTVTDDGHLITFTGNVHSTFRSEPAATVAQGGQP